jgi:hypothetical protein
MTFLTANNSDNSDKFTPPGFELRPPAPEASVLRQNVASHNVYVTKRNCYLTVT